MPDPAFPKTIIQNPLKLAVPTARFIHQNERGILKLAGEIIAMKQHNDGLRILFLISFTLVISVTLYAQTTAFNFQGSLNDGSSPANGRYDLQFKLFTSLVGGTQVFATVDRPNTLLVNGVFSTTLEFNSQAFNGASRFLEIAVRPTGSPNQYVILGSRQQILPVPYAIQAYNSLQSDLALTAGSSQQANTATTATNATNATLAQNSQSLGGVAASNYARLDLTNPGQLVMEGNVRQSSAAGGLIKALVEVDGYSLLSPVSIVRCYNGVTGESTGNCGFTISSNLPGVYQLDLGFQVSNRFVSIIPRYDSGAVQSNNYGANYQFHASVNSLVQIFTFVSGDPDDTTPADFMVIVY